MEKKIITEILRIKEIMNKNLLFEVVTPKLSYIRSLIAALDGGGTFYDFKNALRAAKQTAAGQWDVILTFSKTNPTFFTKLSRLLYNRLSPELIDAIQKVKDDILVKFENKPNLNKAELKEEINTFLETRLGTSAVIDIFKMDLAKFIDDVVPRIVPPPVIPLTIIKDSYAWANEARIFLLKSIKQKFIKEKFDIKNIINVIKESSDLTQKQLALRDLSVHYMSLIETPVRLKIQLKKFFKDNDISKELRYKIMYGEKVIDPVTGAIKGYKGGDKLLQSIMSGKYDLNGPQAWKKLNNSIFTPLREAFLGNWFYKVKDGSYMSVVASRWSNFLKTATFKTDNELLELAASRTVGQRIFSIIQGIAIQNFIIIPSMLALGKTFNQSIASSKQKSLSILRTEFIKNCEEGPELDAESLKKYGTCEEQADAIFDGKLSVKFDQSFGQALIKNFKTSLPVGIDNGNPYNLDIIPEDYKNAVMVLSWLGAWTNYDDLLAGTYNTAESFYNRLNDNTEKEQKLVSDRIKCLNKLKGIKEIKDEKAKALAYLDFEKCIEKTIAKKSNAPIPPDVTQTDTTKTVQTNTITPQPQPSVVYKDNEESFKEFLKTQIPPETYNRYDANTQRWFSKDAKYRFIDGKFELKKRY
jgi:hypothetical protein